MKLILLAFTLFVWSNTKDVNSIQLDIKETKDPIVPPKTILIIGIHKVLPKLNQVNLLRGPGQVYYKRSLNHMGLL